MKVVIADDDPVLLGKMKDSLAELNGKYAVELCGVAKNGAELINIMAKTPGVDLVITDIRMPVKDGLSALVYLRPKYARTKIVMLSSESPISIRTKGGDIKSATQDYSSKIAMLDKIKGRVVSGQEVAGKINSILEGCEKLALDPYVISEKYGAQGFVRKPVTTKKLQTLMERLEQSQGFVKIEIISN